jgi:serine/threonine protein kinase/Leucine-rich repeat (LRR) protein
MVALPTADQDRLQKLLLGQLPTAEVERLATEYADDGRLAALAESLAGQEDALLSLLHNHEKAAVDPEGERLVARLLERLKPALCVAPRDETTAMYQADASTELSSPSVASKPQSLPEWLEYYRPMKVLGQGGMGTVYLAEDTRLGREVAIKTLRPELAIIPQAKERFLREARSAAKLEHDHIIPIYSVGEAADGTPYLAMPLLKGEPLDALIHRTGGPLPVALVVRLAREVASGLAVAHARKLIHRDIKPANIWLEAPTGRVKILDFGLAKAADSGNTAEAEMNLTASGAIVGTPAYMAPEQASNQPVDGRADLFSLGCVLYELLTGQRAFAGPNTMSILMSLVKHTPPAPDMLGLQCPAALSQLVMQLLEKDAARRPASAEAVIQTLSELDIAPATTGIEVSGAALAAGSSHSESTPRNSTTPVASAIPLMVSTPNDVPRPSFPLKLQPTTARSVRKRATPKQRVALALGGMLLMLLAAMVFRIQTDQGTLIVTIEDPGLQAILEQDGLVIHDKTSDRTWTIKAAETKSLPSGEYQVEGKPNLQLLVTDDSGAELKTDSFTLKRKGEVRVRVALEQAATVAGKEPTVPTTSDPDRRAAEWALSIGSTIYIEENGQGRGIVAGGELPQGAFHLTHVQPEQSSEGVSINVTDAGLAHLKDCENLTGLTLRGNHITDAGMAYFKNCKKLTDLRLQETRVTDAGLANFTDCRKLHLLSLIGATVSDAGMANFKDCKELWQLCLNGTSGITDVGVAYFSNCKNLAELDLSGTQVSDAGLANFEDCKDLAHLNLGSTKVTDAGLARFRDCKSLTYLNLAGIEVTEAGLANFRDCKNLTYLYLHGATVSDLGLAHFKDCNNLQTLYLGETQVSDEGLEPFANCPKLQAVLTKNTKVTEAGVKKLAAALPTCKIEWDGGVIEGSQK